MNKLIGLRNIKSKTTASFLDSIHARNISVLAKPNKYEFLSSYTKNNLPILGASLNLNQKRYDSTSTGTIEKSFGLMSESPFTQSIENILINLHDLGSIEWSGAIFLAALTFRLAICFPIKIFQERISAKITNIQPKINETIEKRFQSRKTNSIFLTEEHKKQLSKEVKAK
jgi:hypothetical protein